MFLAKVIGTVTSTAKHESYRGKKILVLRLIDPDGVPYDDYEIGVDYVGAGVGDIVIAGGAPGAAAEVFGIELAPMRILVMGIVDSLGSRGGG